MSMVGDIVRESEAKHLCELLDEKIEKYRASDEAVKALQEVGREVLAGLPNIPDWAHGYYGKFSE
jgi:hypothetical protein